MKDTHGALQSLYSYHQYVLILIVMKDTHGVLGIYCLLLLEALS